MGCTVGAKILENENALIVFKNKDFQVKSYSDQLSLEHSHAFGVRGVDLSSKNLSGFSIGFNKYGLVAVNTNVLTTSDYPYDLITERIVLESKTIEDAIKICEQEVKGSKSYQWCNMVVATPKKLVAIELTSSSISSIKSDDCLVRTNHHLLLNTDGILIESNPKIGHQKIKNSKIRYKDAKEMLELSTNLKDVQALLQSHNQEAAICRHGQKTVQDLSFNTVYSYTISIPFKNHSEVIFEVIKGPPCQHYSKRLEIQFPLHNKEKEFLYTDYPL